MATTKDGVCAGCGKGGDDLKKCNACKLVKYCGVTCQRAHRPKHKKECKRRAAELHDEALFRHPPSQEECSICFLKLPIIEAGKIMYKPCCGKFLCSGCMYAAVKQDDKKEYLCPFCRTPSSRSIDEEMQRLERRMKLNDPEAINIMGHSYLVGKFGLQEDTDKAQELFHKAAEYGSMCANYYLGGMHCHGDGVQRDTTKANHYWELAAMAGHAQARYYLGDMEDREGNYDRAMKHYMISANVGDDASLSMVKTGYVRGLVTKDKFAQTLRAHKESQDELKSEWRDKAAATPPDTWRRG